MRALPRSAASTFFAMQDMIHVLITHIHLLPDLLAVRQLSAEIWSWCRDAPHCRLVAIAHRFFLDCLDHFLTVVHETGTIITGSCALNMLLGDLYGSSLGDLNLIVPHGMFSVLDTFLQHGAGYVNAGEQMSHSSVNPSVSRFVRYRKCQLSVSVTQAGAMGRMGVIIHGNTTADMTFMTVGGVATLYPEFTLHGRNLCAGERTQHLRGEESRIGSSKMETLSLESDASFTESSCGRSCPSLWRSAREYGPHGIFNWDMRYDVKRVFEGCDIEWRLRERCVNLRCAHNCVQRDGTFYVPCPAMPADEADIAIQELNITRHLPPYETLYVGALYATGSQQPVLVHIPLKRHVSVFRFPCDLEIAYWVNQRDTDGRVSFASNYTHTVHCTSDKMAQDLSASFTFFCESFMNLPPTNSLLSTFKNGNSADLEDGNILIIKHPMRDVHSIQNMVHSDLALTDKLLRWALRTRLHWK